MGDRHHRRHFCGLRDVISQGYRRRNSCVQAASIERHSPISFPVLILDEVLCGLGRTGRWFAAEHYDVIPDLITLGKGLGGGVVALSAVGVQGKYFDTICKGSGGFIHGGTFSHHNVAAAAGNAVINIIERDNLVHQAEQLGHLLGEALKLKLADHPKVVDIRGKGLLWGVEIVQDNTTLAPYPRNEKVTERLWKNLFDQGVLAYSSTGLAGIHGDAIIYGPPFIINEEQILFMADALAKAVDNVLET